MKTEFQQGDVIFKRATEIQGKKLEHLVVAEGEHTGHKHQVIEGAAELYESNGTLFLKVLSESAIVIHEEHKAIEIPQGDWRIGIVKEYDHFAEEARNVAD